MSSTIRASSALRNQGGRTDSWSSVPSIVIGVPPSGLTNSWNGARLGLAAPEPLDGADPDLREAGHAGLDDDARRVDVELEVAVGVGRLDLGVEPRVAAVVDGEVVAARSPSRGRCAARARRTDRGTTPTSIEPSSTADPAGSSRDRARRPNGTTPAGVEAARGGRNTSLAVALGAREQATGPRGSAAAQPAASPRTSSVNSSTTLPVLRTRTVDGGVLARLDGERQA